jgi:hypothetical protein
MVKPAVERSFVVDVAPDTAWERLAQVERWPEWAPHIVAVTVDPRSELGPRSSGNLRIRRLGRNSFRMTTWDPPHRWEWSGGLPGVRIDYDHRFSPAGDNSATLTWTVTLRGPLATVVRPVFARIYGRNVDRAIPQLQAWILNP